MMNLEKIKEMLRDKKVMTIAGVVAGALIITVAGVMILNKDNSHKNVASDKKIEDKSSGKKSDDSKDKIVLDNIENKKEELVEEVADINIAENSTSQEKEAKTEKDSNKSKVENVADNKESNDNSNNNTNNSSSNKNNNISNNSSNKNEHNHTWVEVYKDVVHVEEGHWEDVVVTPAWTENIPVYEERELSICNGCGKDITNDPWGHIEEQMLQGNTSCGGYHSKWQQVQVGTNNVNHPAVTEKRWIIDKSAWTEKVLSGHKCSSCGQVK